VSVAYLGEEGNQNIKIDKALRLFLPAAAVDDSANSLKIWTSLVPKNTSILGNFSGCWRHYSYVERLDGYR